MVMKPIKEIMKQVILTRNILLYNTLMLMVHKGMFVQLYNWGNADMQLMHAQDFIFMRFADVLLMHSEITGTATGMNAVRARAGLTPVGYSLTA